MTSGMDKNILITSYLQRSCFRWLNAILDTASTWLAVVCTVVTLSPRMSTQPLPPSRPREPSSLLTGVPLGSRSESTTSPQQLSLEVIWPRYREPSACCLTPLPSLRLGLVWTTSLISCTPRELSSTGTSEKVWRRESSPKPVRIWQP